MYYLNLRLCYKAASRMLINKENKRDGNYAFKMQHSKGTLYYPCKLYVDIQIPRFVSNKQTCKWLTSPHE